MKKRHLFQTTLLLIALTSCGGASDQSDQTETVDLIPVVSGETYVYVNNRGEIEVTPEVEVIETSVFRGNYALVNVKQKGKTFYGYLNRRGQLALPAEYVKATIFSEGLAWVKLTDGALVAIDETGNKIIQPADVQHVRCFQEGLAAFQSASKKWGYMDKTGKTVIEPVFSEAKDFSNGLAAFYMNGYGGYINRKGELAIPGLFGDAREFTSNGYAIVKEKKWGAKYGVINRQGKYVIEPAYDVMYADGDEFYVSHGQGGWRDAKCGYINIRGEETIPVKFNDLKPFMGSRYAGACASFDDKYCIIDRQGKVVVEPRLSIIESPFTNGMAVVHRVHPEKGYDDIINEKGEILLELRFTKIAEDYWSYWREEIRMYREI